MTLLANIDAVILVFEMFVLIVFLYNAYRTLESRFSAKRILTGAVAPALWLGVAACGLIIPFFLELQGGHGIAATLARCAGPVRRALPAVHSSRRRNAQPHNGGGISIRKSRPAERSHAGNGKTAAQLIYCNLSIRTVNMWVGASAPMLLRNILSDRDASELKPRTHISTFYLFDD